VNDDSLFVNDPQFEGDVVIPRREECLETLLAQPGEQGLAKRLGFDDEAKDGQILEEGITDEPVEQNEGEIPEVLPPEPEQVIPDSIEQVIPDSTDQEPGKGERQ
jgi:hypothetical protein